MLHLVGWKGSDFDWVYTSMDPGADEFDQAFTVVNSTPQSDEFFHSPGIDLFGDDVPLIAYGVGYSAPTHYLYYQEYNPGSGLWGSAQTITSNSSSIKYAPVFMYLFSSDFHTHIWYLAGETIYHTITSTPSPSPWLSGVGNFTAVRLGANDVAFLYTDLNNTQLSYRTWGGSSSTPIWTAPVGFEIGGITLAKDSHGSIYVCFGTCKTLESNDTSFYKLHCFKSTGGMWQELESINGTASEGPMPQYPCSIAIATDRYGNEHLHMVYTALTLPSLFSVQYTYYEETDWHPPKNLDALHSSINPQIAVDPTGTHHVVYTWWVVESETTMMYVRGTPGEPQNQ
jgi:hypothetical protein